MHYSTGNIMDYIGRVSAICITTNGFVKSNGECVMGRGIAKQFADKYPHIPKLLGDSIKAKGNNVNIITSISGTDIVSFPVKPISVELVHESYRDKIVKHAQHKFNVGDRIPGFYCKAYPYLIQQSCKQLKDIISNYKFIVMPLLGSGAGELSFKKDVEPIITEYFKDNNNIYVMSFNESDFTK